MMKRSARTFWKYSGSRLSRPLRSCKDRGIFPHVLKALYFVILLLFAILWGLKAESQTFFDRHAEGWHWYQDSVVEETTKPSRKTLKREYARKTEALKNAETPSQKIARERQNLQAALDAALVDPTPENVKDYLNLQSRMLEETEKFAHVWQQTIMLNPELDETVRNPVDQNALHVYYAQKAQEKEKKIRLLSKEYGLFFFFRGQCSYCHAFAPIVKQFSEKYGWSVLPISLDGGSIREFPKSRKDNGTATRLKIQHVPALVAIHPTTGQMIPLAYGMVSEEEIEIRALALSQNQPKGGVR